MEKIIFDIIEILVIVVFGLISRYAIPYVKNMLGEQKIDVIVDWTKRFVNMAEQVISGHGKGEEKRELVARLIAEKAKELNIKLTDEEIRTLIEDAYTVMIKNQKDGE